MFQSSGWGWGGWGTSMLSKATQSVSTFKSTIGKSLSAHGLASAVGKMSSILLF